MKTLTGYHVTKTPIISLSGTHEGGMTALPYIALIRVNYCQIDEDHIIDVIFSGGAIRVRCGEEAAEEIYHAARNTSLDSVEPCDDPRYIRKVEVIEKDDGED